MVDKSVKGWHVIAYLVFLLVGSMLLGLFLANTEAIRAFLEKIL